ncbi:DUF6168 family protein [Flavobacteriaceae bacterium GSB9]|nr:DUF6168 family protein [Flavobacteriaceae bacterium GSB9]
MNFKSLILNCSIVGAAAIVAFVFHWAVVRVFNLQLTTGQLLYSYTVNILMANGVIVLLFLLKKKLKDQLGFIFMASSLVKFAIFFMLFYPKYNADGDLTRLEFLTFFVPYVVCLIVECVILSRFLNSLDDLNS